MTPSPQRFAALLQEGITAIASRTSKPKGVIRDELGYAIGRKGGSAIEYWAYGDGRIPSKQSEVADLARALVDAGKLDYGWVTAFLESAGYPDIDGLVAELFPDVFQTLAHNLPLAPTPFIGRENELLELAALIANPNCRLITLVGTGGSGKTRLALEAARQTHTRFADGAYFVPLAPLSDADLTASTVAGILNFTLTSHTTSHAQILRYLRSQKLLLILDNVEQLLVPSAQAHGERSENSLISLVTSILQQAPDVMLLVTSRARLNIQGEWVYEVGGLEVPSAEEAAAGVSHSAFLLFAQTAQRIRNDFSAADAQADILHICELVEGMPLALELAAAWVRVLSCREIASQIEESLGFLTTTLRDLPRRHHSLLAVFDHSWALLSDEEQAVFAACSVFRGGFTRQAATEIASASLTTLLSLVDKSLLTCDSQGRYTFHELARQYAARQLAEMGKEVETRNRHLAFFMELSEEAEPHIRSGPQCARWHDRVELEHDNVRSALDWSYTGGVFALGARIVGALWEFWMNRSYWDEGKAQAERFLKVLDETVQPVVRAKVLHTAGVCSFYIGRFTTALTWLRKCETISRNLPAQGKYTLALALIGQAYTLSALKDFEAVKLCCEGIFAIGYKLEDEWIVGHAWHLIGIAEQMQGNRHQACRHFLASVTCFSADGDGILCGSASMRVGEALYEQGDYAAAHTHLMQGLAVYTELKDTNRASTIQILLGCRALALGELNEAEELLSTALVQKRKTSHTLDIILALETLGMVIRKQGHFLRARALHHEALLLALETEHSIRILRSIDAFACLAVAQGELKRAALLFGAAEALEDLRTLLPDPHLRVEHECLVACVRKTLGETAFTHAWNAGAAMSLQQAADYALDGSCPGDATSAR